MILDYTLAIEALADGRKPSMKLSFLSASIEDKIEVDPQEDSDCCPFLNAKCRLTGKLSN